MKQLKYIGKDIKSNIGKYIILFIQILSSLLLITGMLLMYRTTFAYENKIKKLESYGEGYYLYDRTDINFWSEKIANDDAIPRLQKLYDFIFKNEKFKALSFNQWNNVLLEDEKVNLINITDHFIDYFNLKLHSGQLFEGSDFSNVSDEIPIIMGYSFIEKYNIGQTVTVDDHNYKIIGFLENNQYYMGYKSAFGSDLSLNKSILVPYIMDEKDHACYQMAIWGSYIFTDNIENMNELCDFSASLDLFTFEIMSFDDRMQLYKADMNQIIQYLSFILFSILIFSLISIIANLLMNVKKNQKEFVIHLLCGGTINSIATRLMIQIFIIILISAFINFIVFGIKIETLITFVIGILLGVIILTLPLIELRKQNINEMFRRCD